MKCLSVQEVALAFELIDSETGVFYNTETGQFEFDRADMPDAYRTEESLEAQCRIACPTHRELDEYGIMVEFIDTLTDLRKSELLRVAVAGRGAFRRFKDTLRHVGLVDAFYAFRSAAFLSLAIQWCEENGLAHDGAPLPAPPPQAHGQHPAESSGDAVLSTLLAYAGQDENIRAVLLEGSRAYGDVDVFSDYDIVFVTQSNVPYFDGAVLPFLVECFGEIAVMQTPDNGDPRNVYTHLIQFSDGLRIDLTFNAIAFLRRTPLESATVAVLDKDGLFAAIPPPNDADFWLIQPDAAAFARHCNQFWWCAPYVAKAVARKQLLHALELLSDPVRKEYAAMLTHLVGARNGWARVNPGKHGSNLKRLLPPDETHYLDTLLKSYPRANADEIHVALHLLLSEYQRLAAAVAHTLGFAYDAAEGERTMRFIQLHRPR